MILIIARKDIKSVIELTHRGAEAAKMAKIYANGFAARGCL
jgi:hypothetical protein